MPLGSYALADATECLTSSVRTCEALPHCASQEAARDIVTMVPLTAVGFYFLYAPLSATGANPWFMEVVLIPLWISIWM